MRYLRQIVPILIFAFIVVGAGRADVEKSARIALVIGNSGYKIAPPLANPANDARLIAETLRDLGFEVIERIDADRETILLATFELQDRLIAAGKDAVGLFFYAGHGVQVAGENYFIPLKTEIKQEREVPVRAVGASFVLQQMEFAGNRMNFVILDACRNNPFPASTRATMQGLARMQAPAGSMVAYSTGPGEVAVDGSGDHSPYVLALNQAMRTPGVAAEMMFKRVREYVLEATNGKQTPWEESSLQGRDFYFTPPREVAAPRTPPAVIPPSAEQTLWRAIESSNRPSDYQVYLADYPEGVYASLARSRADALEQRETRRPTPSNGKELEIALWDAIKNSADPAEYEAYLEQFPDGTFTALVEARIATLHRREIRLASLPPDGVFQLTEADLMRDEKLKTAIKEFYTKFPVERGRLYGKAMAFSRITDMTVISISGSQASIDMKYLVLSDGSAMWEVKARALVTVEKVGSVFQVLTLESWEGEEVEQAKVEDIPEPTISTPAGEIPPMTE